MKLSLALDSSPQTGSNGDSNPSRTPLTPEGEGFSVALWEMDLRETCIRGLEVIWQHLLEQKQRTAPRCTPPDILSMAQVDVRLGSTRWEAGEDEAY